jgi:ATP-dependent exoDNAse (exonuclease V) beta subunit
MLSDGAARSAALDPQRSFIVQAPAGSGKTGLLVYRMLSLLSRVELPQQVLAITFTRKATAEMRERVLELLQMAQAGKHSDDAFEQQGIDLAQQVLVRDSQLEWNLLNSPHQLQILTIDSFCAKLTASMPWLSRLGDRPRTTDNADVHYAAAVEQLLSELFDDQSETSTALQTVLMELDFNYNRARQLFTSMLAKRDQWLRHLLQNDLPSLRNALERSWLQIVEQQLAELESLLTDSALQALCRLACGAANERISRYPDTVTPLDIFIDADVDINRLSATHWRGIAFMLIAPSSGEFRKTVSIKLGFVAKSNEAVEIKSLLAELQGDQVLRNALVETSTLPEVQYSDEDWQQLLALEKVLKSLAAYLQLRFRAAGECDHSEVTQRANLALQELENPTDLGLRMDYALHHILVDEFQDTSTGQIQLLKRLTAGWSGDEGDGLQAKTLFLVGDPMQSIYRFREADVGLFLQVADNQATQVFENLDVGFLQLSENFRSASTLVEWFNSTFKSSFPKHNEVLTGAIEYSPATSNRKPNMDCVEYLFAHDKSQEAELLLNAVTQSVAQLPDDSSRVAILVRSRSQLDYLLPVLRRAGVQYVGVDIQPLAKQQAVIDVITLCKAICREDDRLSWLALLRGPWCGLSLTELKSFVSSTELTVWQQLTAIKPASLSDSSRARLERFISVMRQAKGQRQQVDLSALTRWAWQGLGGGHCLFGASKEDIEIVFNLIGELQRGGDLASMSDLDKAMDALYAQPSEAAARNAKVVVSTMHKSKGLQYHTVILPGVANQARANDKAIMMWAEQQNDSGDTSLLLAPLRLAPTEADHYSYLRKLDTARARNELVRLMYVASTRAEQKLILLGRGKADTDTGETKAPIKSSLLATVWDALDAQFDFSMPPNAEAEAERVLSKNMYRLPDDFNAEFADSIDWQVAAQLNSTAEQAQDSIEQQKQIEYSWATEVATGVGIVLHDWLQHNLKQVLSVQVDSELIQRWRVELLALRVPADRIEYAIKRLRKAVANIQSDTAAHFIFQSYEIEKNEYALSAFEHGSVQQYRIDRSFVDQQGVRWIVDYKSTDTHNSDIEAFVDEQVLTRHQAQLQKYGDLMSQIDSRPIKLAVYFPLLKTLRAWSYQPNS